MKKNMCDFHFISHIIRFLTLLLFLPSSSIHLLLALLRKRQIEVPSRRVAMPARVGWHFCSLSDYRIFVFVLAAAYQKNKLFSLSRLLTQLRLGRACFSFKLEKLFALIFFLRFWKWRILKTILNFFSLPERCFFYKIYFLVFVLQKFMKVFIKTKKIISCFFIH